MPRPIPFLMPWELMSIGDKNTWITQHVMNDWREMDLSPAARPADDPEGDGGKNEVRLLVRGYAQNEVEVRLMEARLESDGLWHAYFAACVAVRLGEPQFVIATEQEIEDHIQAFTPEERAHGAYLAVRARALGVDLSFEPIERE